jgi:RHS repeat-associated protein
VVGGTRYYVYYDGAGSVAGMFNTSGTNVASYSYDPYGTTTASGTQASANLFRFKQGYQDTTGFYKFGTRYYNSTTAAWTQQDSIAGSVQNPAAVNRYPYAGADPVNEVDPSGTSGDPTDSICSNGPSALCSASSAYAAGLARSICASIPSGCGPSASSNCETGILASLGITGAGVATDGTVSDGTAVSGFLGLIYTDLTQC